MSTSTARTAPPAHHHHFVFPYADRRGRVVVRYSATKGSNATWINQPSPVSFSLLLLSAEMEISYQGSTWLRIVVYRISSHCRCHQSSNGTFRIFLRKMNLWCFSAMPELKREDAARVQGGLFGTPKLFVCERRARRSLVFVRRFADAPSKRLHTMCCTNMLAHLLSTQSQVLR